MTAAADPRGFWNDRFAGAGDRFVFGTEPNDFLVCEAHRLAPASRVLSVADGEGRNSVFLAAQGHDVDALEFAPAALAKARILAGARNVTLRFIETDVFAWDWPVEAYDAVVAIFIQFADPVQRASLFARMMAALRPGGVLLLQGYAPEQLKYGTGGPSQVDHLYTEAMLLDAFRDHETVLLRRHDSVINEGDGHRGMSALVDMVVRKLA